MMRKKIILLIFMLLSAHLACADLVWADSVQKFDVKALKEEGKISSLEYILDKLSSYNINRLIEIELKRGSLHDSPDWARQQFIYKIEYVNNKGIVLEIEVDALTAEVLKHEYEY